MERRSKVFFLKKRKWELLKRLKRKLFFLKNKMGESRETGENFKTKMQKNKKNNKL
jgi:hypothetical protein